MTVSYRPGSWFGVVGERVIAALAPADKSRAASLWSLVDDGAAFDAVIDAAVAGGLSTLTGLVVISVDPEGGSTRVIVRGPDAAVALTTTDGPVVLADTGDALWTEKTLTGVTGFSISVAEPTGDAHTLPKGLVRIGSVEYPAKAVVPSATVEAMVAAVAPLVEELPDEAPADGSGLSADEGLPLAEVAPAFAPDPLTDALEPEGELADAADEVTDDLSGVLEADLAGGDPAAEGDPAETGSLDPVDAPLSPIDVAASALGLAGAAAGAAGLAAGATAAGAVPPVPLPVFAPEPVSEPESAAPAPDPEPEPAASSVPVLTFSSGDVVRVDAVVVVGRNPDRSRIALSASDGEPRIVKVPSPNQEISSTHAEVRPGSGADAGFAVLTDLGSTNGTILIAPGGDPEELRAHTATRVVAGTIIDLGDGLTITVG